MSGAIGGTGNTPPPSFPSEGQRPDAVALVKQMQPQIGQLADSLSTLLADNSQAGNTEFLQRMATIVNELKQTVEKALNLGRKI